MDIIDRVKPPRPTRSPPGQESLRGLLSPQVAGSRYIFPDLAPAPRTRWTIALAGREECRPDYVVDRSSYPFHVVEFISQGVGAVRLGNGRPHRLSPGSVFSCAADQACLLRCDPAQPMVKFFFALSGRDVRPRLAEAGLAAGSVRHLASPAEALVVAEEIVREGQRHHATAPAICLKLFELLLLRIAASNTLRTPDRNDRARESFLRSKGLIDDAALSLRTLEEVAAAANLAPATICRLFQRFQGLSPYQYLLRRKMAAAAEMLLEGAMVKEAAARVGFEDQYHFSRCFKSAHGVAPNSLRQLSKQMEG
jgi:AraC-like DNA-binding protein